MMMMMNCPECGASVIERAKTMFEEDAARLRDKGTCVLGAGIRIGPITLRNPHQGNLSGHEAAKRAIGFLRSKGVECEWYDGVMD